MSRQHSHILQPITIGPRTLRCRVYVPAHQPGLADDGSPGARYISYQRERARGGAAMQITGATPVIESELWPRTKMLVNADDRIIPGYARLAEAVHLEGGTMLAQLAHPGPGNIEGDAFAASRTVSEMTRQVARAATIDDIDGAVEAYRAAASRVAAGGLDGVEVMMAFGYLLTSFISPALNKRDDEYGGTLENRLRLPRRVLAAVRGEIGPDCILGIRLVADELYDGGLTIEDTPSIAAALVPHGRVDYVSVIVGNNLFRLPRVAHWPPSPAPHGLFRHLARAVREAVDVPVAAVGRVTTTELAEEILAAGDADLVGMVRAHIADPAVLVKARQGRSESIRPCVGVNFCMNELLAERSIRCVGNPLVGREGVPDESPLADGYRAVVIGGGVAGMEAARRLAMRGAAVSLFEREADLGGQVRWWSAAPSRIEVRRLLDWWAQDLDRLGVEIHLETTAREVPEADLIVVATGATPVSRDLPGLRDSSIAAIPLRAALESGCDGHVVVWDEMGRIDALLVAERLAGTADRVTLVTSCLHPGEDEGIVTLYPHLRRLGETGVRIVERARPSRADGSTLMLTSPFGSIVDPLDDVDAVVSWHGSASTPAPTVPAGIETRVIGDARLPRRMQDAVAEGAELAWSLA